VSATRIPSDYAGSDINVMSNEEMNIPNQERNQNAEGGSSRTFHVALDNDGHDIDLNNLPKNF